MQLSLEDNDIDTLAGVAKLTSLMELYMGNNRVSTLREAQHLKDLPKLIILDLCGNPLCLQPEYRLYLIFYVRRLKVPGGTAAQQQTAELLPPAAYHWRWLCCTVLYRVAPCCTVLYRACCTVLHRVAPCCTVFYS